MKGIDGGYKLSELLFGRGGSADAIINVAAVELRFWAVVLAKNLMFDKTYKKIGVAGSHFSIHGHAISLFAVVIIIAFHSVVTTTNKLMAWPWVLKWDAPSSSILICTTSYHIYTCPTKWRLNPSTPKISLVILLTISHTVLVMLVWRIWYWIN